MLYFGTSGFSYNDWVGAYYPPKMPRQEWLHYYAREFNALELNSSYYAIPQIATVKSMIAKTGDSFLFSVKANQEMTHTRQNENKAFVAFVQMLRPFIDAGKLGCVLAQFPYSFSYNRQNQDYSSYSANGWELCRWSLNSAMPSGLDPTFSISCAAITSVFAAWTSRNCHAYCLR